MGSKKSMLKNGLGDAIHDSVASASRVYDLFSGSGAVASHIAQHYDKEVIAVDLQTYAVVLAKCILERDRPIIDNSWISNWFERALALQSTGNSIAAQELQASLTELEPASAARQAQALFWDKNAYPISNAYGGYYFSPLQSMWLDHLRRSLPKTREKRDIALASLVHAASKCAAAPGHTAQPFKANQSAGRFLIEAWERDLPQIVSDTAKEISSKHASIKGRCFKMDANLAARKVQENDLVFLDPPYSGVHYSRFYHVLETVARGNVGSISGIGRYPPQEERPRSDYSLRTRSKVAFDDLLAKLSRRGANVLITFPAGSASNGLSGDEVVEISSRHFKLLKTKVSSRFSTLGGDAKHRAARQYAEELILHLSAK
jgi:adenine-specific DNA-methyltransferase